MPRNRKTEPGADPGAGFNDIRPDPAAIGGVAEAPFVRLPDPSHLFSDRAARLRSLAPGHTMESYLLFLAHVADAQAATVAGTPPPEPIPADQIALRSQHAMPPITEDQVRTHPGMLASLHYLLAHIDLTTAPLEAQEAADNVRAMTADEQVALAADIAGGAFPMDRVAESLYVAAAVQAHFARLAATLEATSVTPAAEAICPVCGGAPVSSVVVGWTQASKARYCACSLCGTLWNHVRIKCTACGSTEGIAYSTIEGGSKTVGIETCETCHSYIKHMQQHEEMAQDPLADDVASYALDLLAAEKGYRHHALNPLFLIG